MKLLGLLAFISVIAISENYVMSQTSNDFKNALMKELEQQEDAAKKKASERRDRQAKGLEKTTLREIVDEIEKITKSAEKNILKAKSTADKQDAIDQAEAEFLEYLSSQDGRSLDVRVVIKDNIKDKAPLSIESSLLVTSKLPKELSEFRVTGKTIQCENELQFHTSTANQKQLEPDRAVILRGDLHVIREGEAMEISDQVPIHLFSHSVRSILSSKVRNPNIHYSQRLEARLANVQFLPPEDGEGEEELAQVAEVEEKEKMEQPPKKVALAKEPKTTSIKSIVNQLDKLTRVTGRDVSNAKSTAEKQQEIDKHEEEIVDFLVAEDGNLVEFSVTVKDISKPTNYDSDSPILVLRTSSSKDLAEFSKHDRPLKSTSSLEFVVPEDDLHRFQIGTTISVKGELVVSESSRSPNRFVRQPVSLFSFSLYPVLSPMQVVSRDRAFKTTDVSIANATFVTPKDRKIELQNAGEAAGKNP